MRQENKTDNKEHSFIIIDKSNTVEITEKLTYNNEKQKIDELLMKDAERKSSQELNGEEFVKKSDDKGSDRPLIEPDSLETSVYNDEIKENPSEEISKQVEVRPKTDKKKSFSPNKQIGYNEKRKSAPVKPDFVEDWIKPMNRKHSYLDEKNR